MGTAQGSILSPLLFNVFMTQLDDFIDCLIETHSKDGGKKISNTEFRSKTWTTKKSSAVRVNEAKAARKKLNVLGVKRTVYKDGERPVKIHYTRYADEFLIGISGEKSLAQKISDEVNMFIKSSLHLDTSRSRLVHAKSD